MEIQVRLLGFHVHRALAAQAEGVAQKVEALHAHLMPLECHLGPGLLERGAVGCAQATRLHQVQEDREFIKSATGDVKTALPLEAAGVARFA